MHLPDVLIGPLERHPKERSLSARTTPGIAATAAASNSLSVVPGRMFAWPNWTLSGQSPRSMRFSE